MGLNIKNRETEKLIKELAATTGETLTEAVTAAVRERLMRVNRKGLAERLMAIGRETAPYLRDVPDHAELLYDEKTGLPK
jgi:antitoxin VapB